MPSAHPSGRSAAGSRSIVLDLSTSRRTQLVEITTQVAKAITESGVLSGICHLYVPHTTAGIVINENADPDVARDLEATLDRLAPRNAGYSHAEGNADSHVKSALVGVSESIPIENGRLALGTWQGIFFCEFDGPRRRQVRLRILSDPT
jgi:secondary thiamine-phosphate synthase enzyme